MRLWLRIGAALSIAFAAAAVLAAPANVGGGLRQIADEAELGPTQAAARALAGTPSISNSAHVQRDVHGHVGVSIYLNGRSTLADTVAKLKALGAEVNATTDSVQFGAISAFVPAAKVSQMAALAGVKSMLLVHKPKLQVGATTSQGTTVLRTDVLNQRGITGTGITIGAMSDSYDRAAIADRAANDIATGDLPGPGNPLGHTQPVVVVQDNDPTDPTSTDEGRAMLQIVHDIAPDSKLCFATAFLGQISFASNILALADAKHGCHADVIVDDVSYSDEPYFSDGIIAKAVDTVAAAGVSYFSSAGNSNQESYDATFAPLSNKRARALRTPVNLAQVPADLTAGGFHNFADEEDPDIVQQISGAAGDDFLVLQWNDPFLVGGVSARYVVLVFDSQGNYHPELSGIDDTFSTDVAVQTAFLPGPSQGDPSPTYFVAYAKASAASTQARRIRSVAFFGVSTYVTHTRPFSPQVYGHTAARGAVSVAADYWGDTKATEYFSSLGPATIYFDDQGNRLPYPQIRLKPDISAVDGVHTTFFIQVIDNSGFPSFFGTSAAAPHAAGVGALLLRAAGGPGALSPAALKRTLIETAHSHPDDDGHIAATARGNGLALSFAGTGWLRLDPTKFTLSFTDAQNQHRTLQEFDLDLAPAGLIVRGSFAVGDPGGLNPADITSLTTVFPSPTLKIAFTHGSFQSGQRIRFGFRFNEASIGLLGRNVNVLAGTGFRATFSDGSVLTGTLRNELTHDWTIADGFGLIDAAAAVEAVGSD
jgi:hypothetical protein